MRPFLFPLFALATLTACGSGSMPGGAGGAPVTRGAEVPTEGYETYVTQHNGFTRIRRADPQPGDAAILRQFEDSNPASPAGFRNLIDLQSTPVRGRVQAEAIGQMASWQLGDGTTRSELQRILRLTTDVEDFNPANIARAGGEIVLSGADYTMVRIGDGAPTFNNQSNNGSLYLAVNFDTETAAIRIINRTLYQHCGQCTPEDRFRVDLTGENLPFNVQTGAFGGEITGEVYELMVRRGSRSGEVSGTILGSIGGAARDDLVAGGVFEATGEISNPAGPGNQTVQVDGLFWASN